MRLCYNSNPANGNRACSLYFDDYGSVNWTLLSLISRFLFTAFSSLLLFFFFCFCVYDVCSSVRMVIVSVGDQIKRYITSKQREEGGATKKKKKNKKTVGKSANIKRRCPFLLIISKWLNMRADLQVLHTYYIFTKC